MKLIAVALAVFLRATPVSIAQSYTWNAPTTGLFSNNANWLVPGAPPIPGTIDDVWNFGGSGFDTYGVTYDYIAAQTLNGINWNSTSLNSTIFAPTLTSVGMTFVPNTLAAGPFMNQNGSSVVFFSPATATPVNLGGTSFDFGGTGTGTVYFNASLAGANQTLTKTGNYRLTLFNSNSATLTGNTVWNLNGGVLDIQNSINNIGPTTTTVNFNGGTLASPFNSTGSTSNSRAFNFQSGVSSIDIGNFNTNFAIAPSAATVSGAPGATLRKVGPGTLSFGFDFSGTLLSDIVAAEGNLTMTASGGLGTGNAVSVLNGAVLTINPSAVTNFAAVSNRDINATGVGFPAPASLLNNNLGSGAIAAQGSAFTYNNNISISGTTSISGAGTSLTLTTSLAESTPNSNLVKEGVHSLILTAPAAYTGTTSIRTGTLSLADANGSLPAGSTSAISIGFLASSTASASGHLLLDNALANNTDRVGNAIPISMNSGRLSLLGNGSASSTESMGATTLQSGTSTITVTPGTGQNAQLTLASLTRNNRSTALLRGTSLGSMPGANVSNIIVTGAFAPGDFVGDSMTPQGLPILRWAGGQVANGTLPTDFITNDPVNGLRFLTAGEYLATSSVTSAANGLNVRLNAAPSNVASDAAINALDQAGFTMNMSPNTFLRINSGLIINQTNSNSLNSAFNAAVIEFGGQEMIHLGQASLVSAYITGANGLTRGASGQTASTLTLNQPNVIEGPITVNGVGAGASGSTGGELGRLIVNNLSSLGNPNNPWVFSGGRIIIQAAPGATLPNNITINPGGSDLNFGAGSTDPGPMFTHTGTITGPGRLLKSGAGTLVLTGDNAASGFTGQTMITAGILSISSANNLGTGGELILNGGRLLVTGNSTFGPERSVLVNAASSIGVDAGQSLVFQGKILGGQALTKTGPGTLVLEAANVHNSGFTISGSPSLRQPGTGGSVVFRGANGSWYSGTAMQVNSTTSLVFDNTAVNNSSRIRDDGAITMAGGQFRLLGNASAPTHELMGTLTIGGTLATFTDGTANRISLEPATNQQMALSPSSLTRTTTRGQLLLSGPIPFGLNPANQIGANIANLTPRAIPSMLPAAGIPGTTTAPILPGGLGNTTLPGAVSPGFLTYDFVAGMKLLDATEYAPTFADANASNININLAGSVAGIDSSTTINSMIMNGGQSITGSGTLTVHSGTILSQGATNSIDPILVAPTGTALHLFTNGDLTLNGSIPVAHTGGVVKTGPGTLTLNATNAFTGGLYVNGGQVAVNNDNQLGATTGVIVLDGGTLQLNSGITSNRNVHVLAGGGTFDTGVNNVSWAPTTVIGIGHTTAVPATAVGPVTKTGSGTLTFGSISSTSFAGGLNIQQGSVVFGASLSNISDAAPIVINGGATMSMNGATADTVGSIAGSGTLSLLTANGTTFTVGSATSIDPEAIFNGNITGTSNWTIAKAGQGDWTINAGMTASSFAGNFSVVGGRLIIGGDALVSTDGVLGNSATAINVGQTSTTSDSASLLTNGAFTVARPLIIPTPGGTNMAQPSVIGTIANSGTTVFSGNITVGTGAGVAKLFQITAAGNSTVDVQSQIAIGGGYTGVLTIEKIGSGTVQMSNGTSTYTGRTVLTSGTLAFGADGGATAGPIGVSTLVVNGGALAAAGGNRAIENPVILNNNVAFTGSDNLAFNPGAGLNSLYLGLNDRTLTVNAPRVTINSEVRGSQGFNGFGGIVKEGGGTLELTGANTYSSPNGTVVNAGRLLVNNLTGSGTGTGPVTINNAAILGGSGTIAGSVTVNNTATLAPGNSPGALTLGSGVTFTGGTFEVELQGLTAGSQYDQLIVTGGDINLGAGVAGISVLPSGYSPAMTDVFVVINNVGSGTLSGSFAGFPDQSIVASNVLGSGIDYLIWYGSYTGFSTSVVIAPVPEPATVLGICAVGFGAVRVIRRRFKKTTTAV